MTKLILLGGFLGAGKTTLMLALAKLLTNKDKKVALITNDQGDFLVDSRLAESLGFPVAEVLNGCFCCRFEDFFSNVSKFLDNIKPDFIIAEPVGSCTDLQATVVAPLLEYYSKIIELAPLFILIDGKRIFEEFKELNLREPKTPKETLLAHQIKEAEFILLSKCELLDSKLRKESTEFARTLNSNAQIIEISSITGENLSIVAKIANSQIANKKNPIELDYEVYAKAEAEYGWYNGTWKMVSSNDSKVFNVVNSCLDILKGFLFPVFENEVAHAKLFAITKVGSLRANIVGNGEPNYEAFLSEDKEEVEEAVITLNVRARCLPQIITQQVENIHKELNEFYKVEILDYKCKALIPSPPKPTFRIVQ